MTMLPSEQAEAFSQALIDFFASVRLAVVLLSLAAIVVLIGAWCPQESAVGQEKIIEQFGEGTAMILIKSGISDIFHTPFFIVLIALLSVNLTVASFKRVFPKLLLLRKTPPSLDAKQIEKLPVHYCLNLTYTGSAAIIALGKQLSRQGYVVHKDNTRLQAEFGKFSRLAASVTHVGLLTLLAGVTLSSWTGFSGFKPIRVGDDLYFQDAQHAKLWIGHLPQWHIRLNNTRRDDYASGDAKQWYSDLVVVDSLGRELATKQISVNDPLTFGGVDVYQSSWGLDQILVSFNGSDRALDLKPMGTRYASFLVLDPSVVLIFSIKSLNSPLRLFAKRQDWSAPRLLAEIPPGSSIRLGSVEIKYKRAIPVSGLQYKCDPGLPITYAGFAFIILGVSLAAIPHRQVFSEVVEARDTSSSLLFFGGSTNKAKVAFKRSLEKISAELASDQGASLTATKKSFPKPPSASQASIDKLSPQAVLCVAAQRESNV